MLASPLLSVAAAALLVGRAVAQCGEGAQQICYGLDGGSPQNIDLEDLQYVADFLCFTGQTNAGGPGAFYTMPASVFCAEWSIEVPGAGTVLPLAKKNNARITSSVLFTDIADAIDGGVGATEEQKKAALMGCAANGGQIGVKTDPANPLYNTKEYKDSKAKPEGIVLKIVRTPGSMKL